MYLRGPTVREADFHAGGNILSTTPSNAVRTRYFSDLASVPQSEVQTTTLCKRMRSKTSHTDTLPSLSRPFGQGKIPQRPGTPMCSHANILPSSRPAIHTLRSLANCTPCTIELQDLELFQCIVTGRAVRVPSFPGVEKHFPFLPARSASNSPYQHSRSHSLEQSWQLNHQPLPTTCRFQGPERNKAGWPTTPLRLHRRNGNRLDPCQAELDSRSEFPQGASNFGFVFFVSRPSRYSSAGQG